MDSHATPQFSQAISIPQRSDHASYSSGHSQGATRGGSGNNYHAVGSDDGSSIPSESGSWSSRNWQKTPAHYSPATPALQSSNSSRKDKQKAVDSAPSTSSPSLLRASSSPLGPSMLSSTSYKSINLNLHGDPDEPPRLITYTKYSQGFVWNDEVFLPSYLLGRYGGRNLGGRKKQYDDDFGDEEQCPITEIFVTDEEAEAMMP